jgi:RimJ/RimL family protein N-acetyltransferase
LLLVAITPALLEAEFNSPGRLAECLRAEVPAEWPPSDWEPHLLATIRSQLELSPLSSGWHRYSLLVQGQRRILIGCLGAFPKADGEVELGYSTLPPFQRQGFGSEAAGALVSWLLHQPGVQRVTAQSFVNRPESIKVMQRCGMIFVGEGDEPGTVRYHRQKNL